MKVRANGQIPDNFNYDWSSNSNLLEISYQTNPQKYNKKSKYIVEVSSKENLTQTLTYKIEQYTDSSIKQIDLNMAEYVEIKAKQIV